MCELFKCIFHFAVAIATGYFFVYDMRKIKFPENEYSWHVCCNIKFISTINLLAQFIYFCFIPILNIFSLVMDENSILVLLPNQFFASIMVPMGLFCAGYYYITPFIHNEYVMPASYTDEFPKWLLHVKYTLPPILILIEMYLSFHRYPSLLIGLGLMYACAFSYIACLHLFHYKTGSWIYPFLQDKSKKDLWLFFSGILLSLLGCYLLGELINNNFWRQNLVLLSCNNIATNKRCQFTQTLKL